MQEVRGSSPRSSTRILIMIELLFVTAVSLLFGISMKIADFLDEHGLKWFKGSAVLFGILWGTLGAVLVIYDTALANVILAMNIAFLLRNRLDYFNHQLAATIIIVSFLFSSVFNPNIFIPFLIWLVAFGSIDDHLDSVKVSRWIFELNRLLPYRLSTFVYSMITGQWVVFASILAFSIAYDVTKYTGEKRFAKYLVPDKSAEPAT